MTYLFDCTTRNAAIGNFNIQELLLDPRTMFKAWLIQSLPFGNRTVFRNTSIDRLERWGLWNIAFFLAYFNPTLFSTPSSDPTVCLFYNSISHLSLTSPAQGLHL